MQTYLNSFNAYEVGNFTGFEDLSYYNREVLKENNFDLDNLEYVTQAKDNTNCDVYHFTTNTKKLRHVGLYNGKIEFNYVL